MKHAKYMLGLAFLCLALVIATTPAVAQYQNNANQYPADQNQQPQNQYPQNQYPQNQYPQNPQNQYPQNPQNQYPQNPQNQYPAQNQQPVNSNITQDMIPAGAQLQIRTNEAINATKQDVGRTFSAEIADNVMGQSGQILIPRGSPATLQISSTGTSTMGVGSNQIGLALQSVSINGRTYNVQTNPVQQSGNRGIGANKRTAEMTGGGALLGTVIGAVAGGAKGAAIGAVLGGGAGAATQVLTRGNEVKVPAETLLTFKLDQPLTLQ